MTTRSSASLLLVLTLAVLAFCGLIAVSDRIADFMLWLDT